MSKKRKTRRNSIASRHLADLKTQDAFELLIHTQVGVPWDIICLQEFFWKVDKLDCGASCVHFNAPKMMGAMHAPAIVLTKGHGENCERIGGESKWIPLEQFTATLEEIDPIWEKFPKHEVPMGLDANAKLVGHSDGFRVGSAVLDKDMTAVDEEGTTYFENLITKNGLVAKKTWTAAAASQEEMYTRREWDKNEMLGNLAVGRTQVAFDLTQSKPKGAEK